MRVVGTNVRQGTNVLAIEFLATLDIFDVTDDAGCGITGDGFDETLVKTNFLKDTQIFALFTLIIGLEHVTALKEELKLLGLELKVRGHRKVFFLLILYHERYI